jgi:hypothetical protein
MNTNEYRLPCECGVFVVVTKRHAGQEVACTGCQMTLAVPTMLGLQKLEPNGIGELQATTPPNSKASATATPVRSNFLFSLSVGISGLATVIAIILLVMGNGFDPGITIESTLEVAAKELDSRPPSQILDAWDELDRAGLGEPEPPWYVTRGQTAANFWMVGMICGFIAVLAAIASGVLFTKALTVHRAHVK